MSNIKDNLFKKIIPKFTSNYISMINYMASGFYRIRFYYLTLPQFANHTAIGNV